MDAKVNIILNNSKALADAQRLLLKEGYKIEKTEELIQKYDKTQRRKMDCRKFESNSSSASLHSEKAPLALRDQHVDLISLSQNVSELNLFFLNLIRIQYTFLGTHA